MIKVDNIKINIENKTIINGVDIVVEKGEFVSLIGPNGSGKSTLIKAITSIIPFNEGKVIIVDKNLSEYKDKELAKIVSTMAQHGNVVESLTVNDIVTYGRSPYKSIFSPLNDEDRAIINESLKVTDVYELKDRDISTLSGGELQRVFLASCLAQKPDVLILDEPTNHLDVMHQYKLLNLIKKYAIENNLTVLCVLHDINQAIKYADKICVLKNGEVKAFGKADEVITEKLMSQIFEIDCTIYNGEKGIHIDFYLDE